MLVAHAQADGFRSGGRRGSGGLFAFAGGAAGLDEMVPRSSSDVPEESPDDRG